MLVDQNLENIFRRNKVETLQNMAAIQIVLPLWYDTAVREVIESCFSNDDHKRDSLWIDEIVGKIKKQVEQLEIPKFMKSVILHLSDRISIHFDIWVEYCDELIFRDHSKEQKSVAYRYMDCICWTSKGTIDELETANVMLQIPQITDFEKFRIMSTYCMEDRLRQISSGEFYDRYYEDVEFGLRPLQYFWNCHFRGRFMFDDKDYLYMLFEADEFSNFSDVEPSNVHAAIYFWSKLDDEQKIDAIKRCAQREFTGEMIWAWLSRLTSSQRLDAFERAGFFILRNLTDNDAFDCEALSIASYLIHQITPADFADLMRHTSTYRLRSECSLLIELWKISSPTQKFGFFEEWTVVKSILQGWWWETKLEEIVFLFTHKTEYENVRTAILMQEMSSCWQSLVKNYKVVSKLNEFVDLVLLPTDAIIFKNKYFNAAE